jgi:hypothetical protein
MKAQAQKNTDRPAAAPATDDNSELSKRCGAKTLAGGPCRAPATSDGSCPMHSTTYTDAEKKAWRSRGQLGQQRSARAQFAPVDFNDPASVQSTLEEVTNAVLSGKLPVSIARVVSSLTSSAAKLGEFRLSERLLALEERLAGKTPTSKRKRR